MNPDEQNAKKSLLTKIGIIIIIAAIFFLWIANLRGVFESNNVSKDNTLKKISDDINQSFKETENRFNEVASSSDNSFVEDLLDKASSTATSIISTTTATAELKEELMDLTKPVTTSPKRTGCPLYINCMPSFGETSRPCVVPMGCENITQIAY